MLLFGELTLSAFITVGLALLVGMTFHEFMHNYVGWLMGDPTPERQGRLTLNPMVHIYWPGWLMFVLIGFGILGFAPINPALMSYPRVRWANRLTRDTRFGLAVLAGPLANLILVVFFGLIFRVVWAIDPQVIMISGSDVLPSLGELLNAMIFWNALFFFFNLIPLGFIDGRHILRLFLPPWMHYQYDAFQNQYGQFVLLGLIMLSFINPQLNLFGRIIGQPTVGLTSFVQGFGMGGFTFTLIVTVAAAVGIVVGWLLFLRPQGSARPQTARTQYGPQSGPLPGPGAGAGRSNYRPYRGNGGAYNPYLGSTGGSDGPLAPFRNFFRNIRTLINQRRNDRDDDRW